MKANEVLKQRKIHFKEGQLDVFAYQEQHKWATLWYAIKLMFGK
jgi:hypothetical protein